MTRRSLGLALAAVAFPAAHPARRSFYGLEQREGVWWFVTPDGRPFFSSGVNVVSPGVPPEDYQENNPSYSALRLARYSGMADWSAKTMERLRRWNFNTVGGWSAAELRSCGMPYTVVLHLGGSLGVPWSDVFAPDMPERFAELARGQVEPLSGDVNLLGYFTDNELGWWPDTILKIAARHPPSSHTKARLVAMLKERYDGDFGRLSRDFIASGASTFDEIADLQYHAGGGGKSFALAFAGVVAERYYRLAHDAVRLYDRNHLILGDRYLKWCPEPVARAATRYVDVVSTNYGAPFQDGGISWFFLDSLHRSTGKPVLVSEFYFCAMENRTGNRNTGRIFPTVETQAQRAAGFSTNLRALAARPYVVGVHWFQYHDEPAHGRASDGEDYNMGLVDIHDRPYELLTQAASEINAARIHARAEPGRPAAVFPRAPKNAELGLEFWPREAALLAAAEPVSFADLFLCWREEMVYVGVHAAAFADEDLYANRSVPEQERMLLKLEIGAPGLARLRIRLRFGPGGSAEVDGRGARVVYQYEKNTRFTVVLGMDREALGGMRLEPGESVFLDASLSAPAGDPRVTWRAERILARR